MAQKDTGRKSGLNRYFIFAGLLGVPGAVLTVVRHVGSWQGWKKKKFVRLNLKKEQTHTTLYKCPACKRESQMASAGIRIWCGACGKNWIMEQNGRIRAWKAKTEFRTVDKWSEWERECIRKEIRDGTYQFEDIVRVETLSDSGGVLRQGSGRLYQTPSGTRLECRYYGEDYTLIRSAKVLDSIHIEYDPEGTGDCVEFPILNDRFRCYLSKKNVVTKLAYATEEIHRQAKHTA